METPRTHTTLLPTATEVELEQAVNARYALREVLSRAGRAQGDPPRLGMTYLARLLASRELELRSTLEHAEARSDPEEEVRLGLLDRVGEGCYRRRALPTLE